MLVLMMMVMLALAWMMMVSALPLRRNARVWKQRTTRLRGVKYTTFHGATSGSKNSFIMKYMSLDIFLYYSFWNIINNTLLQFRIQTNMYSIVSSQMLFDLIHK